MLRARRSLFDRTIQSGRDMEGGAAIGLAGLAAATIVGAMVVRHFGGFDGLKAKLGRTRNEDARGASGDTDDEQEEFFVADDEDEDMIEGGVEYEVAAALLQDPKLGHRAIDVERIDDGVIRLSGFVHNLFEVEHATDLSSRIPGVKRVVARLTVTGDDVLVADRAEASATNEFDTKTTTRQDRRDALSFDEPLVVVTAGHAEA